MSESNSVRKIIENVFESELKEISDRLIQTSDPLLCLSETVELAYKSGNFPLGELLRCGNEIISERLLNNPQINSNSEDKPDYKSLLSDLLLGANYWGIRDKVYYSYANQGSIIWNKTDNNINIELRDDSIFRQLVSQRQTFTLNSASPKNKNYSFANAVELLKNTRAFDFTDQNVIDAAESIEKEIEWKMSYFFSYVPEDSSIEIRGYLYSEFISVYRVIMFYALYERHYSMANDISSVITYTEAEIGSAVQDQHPNISIGKINKIISDISLSSRSTLTFLKNESKYYLSPISFTLVDIISNFLRLHAQNQPDDFSSNIAHIIGNGLVFKIKKTFEQHKNYRVLCDVKLNKFDYTLPDIDLLAMSYEPSLGFHLFIGEVKNNLPAVWAKDYLKASSKNGYITKAISQVNIINEFLNTEQGEVYLLNLIKSNFKDLDLKVLFPHGICVIKDKLIITSQSVGMFFPEADIPIIDGATLGHIIDASDGDTNYIQFHVNKYNEIIDDCIEKCKEKVSVGGYNIQYDAVKIANFMKLAEHAYISDGTYEKLEQESLESGYTMAGSIRHKGDEIFHIDQLPKNFKWINIDPY
ncbi:hypothetical protein [Pseudoalteromonas arctica]|uniref:Uncharacterized protein n=1 Tax=Pseudoalteromonas arctica TaxID=394751 RepID=A0ABU9TM88_9GAMM